MRVSIMLLSIQGCARLGVEVWVSDGSVGGVMGDGGGGEGVWRNGRGERKGRDEERKG